MENGTAVDALPALLGGTCLTSVLEAAGIHPLWCSLALEAIVCWEIAWILNVCE